MKIKLKKDLNLHCQQSFVYLFNLILCFLFVFLTLLKLTQVNPKLANNYKLNFYS